MNKTIQVYFS